MRHSLLAAALIAGAAATVVAVEIPFRDGSVLDAAGYKLNGSYIMLEMADGRQIAYDVADIDLGSLRRAEAAASAAEPGDAPAQAAPTTMGVARSIQVPGEAADDAPAGLTITDQHVRHVRGSGIAGPEDGPEAAAGDGLEEGYEQGGNVLLNNVTVRPTEGGEWQVQGEVVNRTGDTVLDVHADLQGTMPEGEDPWTASVGVSGMMAPDEKGSFTHTFATPASAPDGWTPQVQVNVVWMRGESKLEPNYNRMAPHPSALPYDRGGAGGVDTRDDVID
jgi:hypothetical protein